MGLIADSARFVWGSTLTLLLIRLVGHFMIRSSVRESGTSLFKTDAWH